MEISEKVSWVKTDKYTKWLSAELSILQRKLQADCNRSE